jgi:hypothetical protein
MKTFSIILSLVLFTNVWADETQDGQQSGQQRTCAEEFAALPDSDPNKTQSIAYCQQARAAQQNLQNNPNNTTGNNIPYNECKQVLTANAGPVTVNPAPPEGVQVCSPTQGAAENCSPMPSPASAAAGTWTGQGIQTVLYPQLKLCRGYEGIAARLGSSLQETDRKVSQDGKIFCVKKSGITADWQSCTSALSMYNTIVVAEAAMQVFQGVQTNNAQNQAQNQYNQRAAVGDAQNAAYDAQIATVNSAKQLNQQQAMVYAGAVAALYSKIQSWIKEDKETFMEAGCGQVKAPAKSADATIVTKIYSSPQAVSKEQNCASSAEQAFDPYKGFIYANRDAKAAFTTAAMMYAAKGLMAGIKANQLGNIAKQVEVAKQATEDPYNPATFEYCQVNSTDPKCAGAVTQTPGSGLQDGGFSLGDSFGNNAFNPTGDPDTLGGVDPLPLPGSDVVPDTASPFADDAKIASGILDPAAAASMQAGGTTSGGMGSGGSPSMGGGSASLGANPNPDDPKKENDIKANKADGKYSIAGGGAFQAIKPMKNDNPFANLFDGKGGKLEEDRSIASGDIDGRDSGLFSKISKRYSQVQADKRIEAKNIEE